MRFFLAVILIAILSGISEYFLPWWTVAVVSFVASMLLRFSPGRSFLVGFSGIGLLWLTAALLHDISNQHILSQKMAALFHLPGYALFVLVTVLICGLTGGMAAWAGALVRRSEISK
jgi:hypothetical protein